ncbi:MAG: histidinol-phosphate transaminase [Bifidobacteriaceae bacterium]|jgi:histidinol-phosphate aminotransferase|nr:histidinol-phosphate transaminase [Bifidobacteriaceae bacterium]
MPKVPVRPSIASLPAYRAGAVPSGRLVYKLSSNELPYPPLPGVLAAVGDAAADLNRYPRQMPDQLVDAIARFYGVDSGQVAVGAGAVAVLGHALTAFVGQGDQVVYPWRSFEMYPILAGVAGAEPVTVPLAEGGRLDLPALAAALTPRTRAVLLCSPNNPTGPAIRRAEFEAFMAAVPPTALVVFDEAYAEFVTDPAAVDGVAAVAEHANLLAVRTFSKAYGLAGMRVGYCVGRHRLIEAVRAATTPFSVTSLAELAAVTSLKLTAPMRQRVAGVIATRAFVAEGLAAQGWDVPDPQGNFVYLALGAQAAPFAEACQRAGVLVRPFPGEGVRVSIGEQAAAERFLEVAATWA